MRRFLLILGLLFLSTVLGLWMLAADARFQRWLGEQATRVVQQVTGLPLQIAWIEWSLLSNALHLGDVVLISPEREPWFEAPMVSLEFGFSGISLNRLRMRAVRIHSPRIGVHITEAMRVEPVESLIELFADGTEVERVPTMVETRFSLDVDEVEIVHADLRFSMEDPPMEARFRDARIRGSIRDTWPSPLALQFERGSYRLYDWRYEGMRLQGQARFADPGLLLESIRIHGAWPQLDLEADGWVDFADEPVFVLDVGGMADASVVNLHYTDTPVLLGTASLYQRMHVHSDYGFRMAGWVAADALEVQGRLIRDLRIDQSMDEDGMDIERFTLLADGGRLAANGHIGWWPEVDIRFRPVLTDLSLDWLPAFFGDMPLNPRGAVSAEGWLRIVDEPAVEVTAAAWGQAHLQHLELVPGTSLPPHSAEIRIGLAVDDDWFRLTRLWAHAEGMYATDLSGAAGMTRDVIDFSGTAEVADLSLLESSLGFSLAGEAGARFAVDATAVEIGFEARAPRLLGTEWLFGHGTIRIDDETLSLDDLDLTASEGRLGGWFRLDFEGEQYLAGVSAEGLQLAAILPDTGWSGRVAGELAADGRLGLDLPRLEGGLQIESLSQGPHNLGNLELVAEPAEAGWGRSRVTLTGGLARGDLELDVAQDLTAWRAEAEFKVQLPAPWDEVLELPELQVQAGARGGRGERHVFGMASGTAPDSGLWASADWDGDLLSLVLGKQGPQLDVEGGLTWSLAGGDWSLAATAATRSWAGLRDWLGEHRGRAWLAMQGDLNEPRKLQGWLRVGALGAVLPAFSIEQQGLAHARAEAGRLRFLQPLRLRVADRGELEISGGIDLLHGWDLRAEGPVPLDLLLPLELGIRDIEGFARVEAGLRGDWRHPALTGGLSLSGARAELQGLLSPLEDVRGRARLEGASLVVENLSARLGEGRAEARGRIGVLGERLGEVDARVQLAADAVQVDRRLTTGVRGWLDLLALPGRTMQVGGDLELHGLRYQEDIAWERAVLQMRSSALTPEFLDDGASPRLDLRIHGRRDLRLQTNLLQGTFELDYQVKGTMQIPRLFGVAEFRPGSMFFFRGQVYTLRRGIVQSIDPSGRVTFLDVEAETVVWHERRRQEYRVILTILGPVDRLQIRFQSEPPLEEVEILTLLSFGVLPDELTGSEGDTQGTAGREISSLILSGQISRIEQEIQSIIGFDRLEIEPAFSSPRSSSSMQITLQKRLSERLRLSLSSGLEVDGEQRVELGYRLLDGFDLSLGWNSQRDSEVGNFFTRPRIVIPLP